MRVLMLVIAALGLAGCNIVYTEAPLFTAADTAGAPTFRTGVWVKVKEDCTFDPAAKAADLPECADAMIMTPDELIPPKKPAEGGAEGPETLPYVLASGEPPVLQAKLALKEKTIWVYQGLRILKRDAEGRVIEGRLWLAQCGPPPAKDDKDGEKPRYLTRKLLPGLKADGDNCIAQTKAAARRAVKASEAWDEGTDPPIRWLRDGTD